MRFLLNIFRRKRICPISTSASLLKMWRFSCVLKAFQIYLLKSFSCNSASLSSPPRGLPSTDFWKRVVLYNSAGLWIAVSVNSIFKLVFLWADHKSTILLQDLYRFRGVGRLRLWLILLLDGKLEWHVPVQMPTATLSLVLALPFHPLHNLQTVRTRRLKGLILQVGRLRVKQ